MATAELDFPHVRQHLALFFQQASQGRRDAHGELQQLRRNTEELISLGIAFYEQIRKHSQELQEQIRTGEVAYSPAMTDTYAELFREWLQSFEAISGTARSLTDEGLQVKQLDEYMKLAARVSAQCVSSEELLTKRQARPLNEQYHTIRVKKIGHAPW